MASKKTPDPANEKPVPESGETATPPPSPPPTPAPPKPSETLVLQDRIGDLAIGRVVRATPAQAAELVRAKRARRATHSQAASLAAPVPALPADFVSPKSEKD